MLCEGGWENVNYIVKNLIANIVWAVLIANIVLGERWLTANTAWGSEVTHSQHCMDKQYLQPTLYGEACNGCASTRKVVIDDLEQQRTNSDITQKK